MRGDVTDRDEGDAPAVLDLVARARRGLRVCVCVCVCVCV